MTILPETLFNKTVIPVLLYTRKCDINYGVTAISAAILQSLLFLLVNIFLPFYIAITVIINAIIKLIIIKLIIIKGASSVDSKSSTS